MNRHEIASFLPHGETMILIDEVLSWNEDSITCKTTSHQRQDNPLLDGGKLPAIAAIEYGAQAMALHESITLHEKRMNGQIKSLSGVVGALKNVSFSVSDLHDIEEPLIVVAERMMASKMGAIYKFEVSADDHILASGRITVNHQKM